MILINGKEYTPKFFGDGTLKMLNMNEYPISRELRTCLTWRFDNLAEYVIIMYLVNYIKDTVRGEVELYLPYVPDARMDRVKDPSKEGHTLKYFCKFINGLGFKLVRVLDPHSPVTMTLLDRAIERNISSYLSEVAQSVNINVLLFPDKGARDRYSYLNQCAVEYGEKVRNWETGRITGFNIVNSRPGMFDGKDVLIIDDICAYGGTFNHAVNAAHEAGAKRIFLFVTHCENDIFKGELINNPYLDGIFTSNSIYRGEHEKIHVIH